MALERQTMKWVRGGQEIQGDALGVLICLPVHDWVCACVGGCVSTAQRGLSSACVFMCSQRFGLQQHDSIMD